VLGRQSEYDDCRVYRDWLVRWRGSRVLTRRVLVHGNEPCLEWHRSEWSFDGRELTFTYGGMGAPPSSDTDMRSLHVRFTPWPFAMTASVIGDGDPIERPAIPARGPIFTLTME
jgi:hypothetical protein